MVSTEEEGSLEAVDMRPGGSVSPPPSTVQGFLAPGIWRWESATGTTLGVFCLTNQGQANKLGMGEGVGGGYLRGFRYSYRSQIHGKLSTGRRHIMVATTN